MKRKNNENAMQIKVIKKRIPPKYARHHMHIRASTLMHAQVHTLTHTQTLTHTHTHTHTHTRRQTHEDIQADRHTNTRTQDSSLCTNIRAAGRRLSKSYTAQRPRAAPRNQDCKQKEANVRKTQTTEIIINYM